ncbi:AAA family ATPase [Roseomonas chloroacetimidivorans]|uniref:AAA family ATPase n=1 Tax=Roseomonas chloroacetimidivorans TaxID=1766656 RepID=UPI003C7386D9
MSDAGALAAEGAALARFVDLLFRYADPASFVSLRAFDQFDRGKPPVFIEAVPVADGTQNLARRAAEVATMVANQSPPVVFAPPVATFLNGQRARMVDVASGVALSVEIDKGDTTRARARLEFLLGPATLVVASGGEWVDPATGEVFPKLHIHWRLAEPTTTEREHNQLQEARRLAALLVGGDTTAAPPVHPLRWPGSWNCKARPKLARIVAEGEDHEIHLEEALSALGEAVDLAGITAFEAGAGTKPGKIVSSLFGETLRQADATMIASALGAIPNGDEHWEIWNRVGMAAWAATGGSAEGLAAWMDWSAKSPKHDDLACRRRWEHFFRSPPTKIGAGTIFYLAQQAGWTRPASASWEGEAPPFTGGTGDQPKPKKKIQILTLEEMEALPPVEYLIDGLVPEEGIVIPYGPPKVGKTFVVYSMALHIAAGRDWCGKKVRQAGVVYVAGEGVRGLTVRSKAMRARYGIGPDIPFWVIPHRINFRDETVVGELIQEIKDTVGDKPIGLTVLDTMARMMPGADENSAQDIGLVIAGCDRVKEEIKCTVMPVHHTGKDVERGMRGSTAITGAVEASILVQEAGDHLVRLINDNQKDAAEADDLVLRLEEVSVGIGRSSLVPMPLDPAERPPEPDKPIELLTQIAHALGGHKGRLTLRKVAEALGMTSGHARKALGQAVPMIPQTVDISLDGKTVRMWKVIDGDAPNSPVMLHREDLS